MPTTHHGLYDGDACAMLRAALEGRASIVPTADGITHTILLGGASG